MCAVRQEDLDRITAMDEVVTLAVTAEITGVAFQESVARPGVVLLLERRVANWAVRWTIAAHPAVDHRAENAGVIRIAALEHADVLAAVPAGGLGPRVVLAPRATPGWTRVAGLDEMPPLHAGPIPAYALTPHTA